MMMEDREFEKFHEQSNDESNTNEHTDKEQPKRLK